MGADKVRFKTIRWGRTKSVDYQSRRCDVELELREGEPVVEALEALQFVVDKMIEAPGPVREEFERLLRSETGDTARVVEAALDGEELMLR